MVDERASVRALVYGRVQGVYFRAYVLQHGQTLGLRGYARNLPHPEAVEVEAEGKRSELDRLVERLHKGPPGARVDRVEVEWRPYQGNLEGFEIR